MGALIRLLNPYPNGFEPVLGAGRDRPLDDGALTEITYANLEWLNQNQLCCQLPVPHWV